MITYDAYKAYDEMLDECYGTVTVAGYTYETSVALRKLDPVAYDFGFNDWLYTEVATEPDSAE